MHNSNDLDDIPIDYGMFTASTAVPDFSAQFKLLNEAADIRIDTSKPLKWYIRSAEVVYKQAFIYRNENDFPKAYILFMKFSNLIVRELPLHSEYSNPGLKKYISTLKQLSQNAMHQIAELKTAIKAVLMKIEADKRKPKPVVALSSPRNSKGSIEELRALVLNPIEGSSDPNQINSWLERYKRIQEYNSNLPVSPTIHAKIDASDYPKMIRPDEPERARPSEATSIPIAPPLEQPEIESQCNNIFTQLVFAENGLPLRRVKIPFRIIQDFLSVAKKNTEKNIETCGVIAGKLSRNEFTLTTLIIPKQIGTSDTCSMQNEEEIVEVQDREDVMSLGWIHTHPTQSCFLSSVDVHTHFPFQLLMAEAVAIVCAPTKSPNFGVFRLTDPPGIGTISKCKISAPFHPHPDVEIYKNITNRNDSHTSFSSDLPLKIIDLR